MKYFRKVRKFVDSSFDSTKLPHFERTVYWVKKLKPDADEALLISAYAHDIQRAFRVGRDKGLIKSKSGFQDENLMKIHQEEGARIMGDYLEKVGANKKLIERVMHLISKHEVGGDKDQNILKDADSLSFFGTNADHFIKVKAKKAGKDKVKKKFDWMYERITSKKAKEIAQPLYLKAMESLSK